MKETVKYGFILGLICLLASGILAMVDAVTDPQIRMQRAKEEKEALEDVLPEAEAFKPVTEGEKTLYFLGLDEHGKLVGFVIKAQGKGYTSEVVSMAGLNLKLEIDKVKIIDQSETPGLGARVSEQPFLAQFKGKGADSLGQVQAITGATISSSAVINSLKSRISALKERMLQEIKNAR